MPTTYVIVRHVEDGPSTPLKGYLTRERAEAALAALTAHLAGQPGARRWGPSGFNAQIVVGMPTLYQHPSDAGWLPEAQSRLAYPQSWALHDAQQDTRYWWGQANPLDRDWTPDSTYTIDAIEIEIP